MNRTKHFHLQLLSQKQHTDFFNLIDNNRSRLEDFFAGIVSRTNTLEDTIEYCKEVEKSIENRSYFPYLILETKTNQLVGLIDVKNIDWNIPKGELGAFIDSHYEGEGIITQLGSTLIHQIVGDHGFKKLFCRVAPRNTRSMKVVERLGFTLEGTIKRDYRTTKGELVDLNYYGKTF